jgi:hypothetical protein
MATRLPPALNLAVLCSYVEFDGEGRPFSLVEPLYALALAPDERGRLPSPHFCLYAQLDDEHASGTFWIRTEARTASGFVLPNGRTGPTEAVFAGHPDPLIPFEVVFDFRDLVFPEPGRYYFHVVCNHMSLHDRAPLIPPLCLRVLPREATSAR